MQHYGDAPADVQQFSLPVSMPLLAPNFTEMG
jgi:hypothetical protein